MGTVAAVQRAGGALRGAAASARAFFRSRRGLYVTAFLLQAALAPFFVHDWDGFVFQESVEKFVAGETPYETAEAAPNFIFLNEQWPSPNSWYAYPPLGLLLMTPVLAVALAAGVANPALLRLALKVPMVAGNLALAWSVGLAVRELGGGETARRRAEAFVLFNPFLIFIGAVWGMFDAWIMALLIGSAVLLSRNRYAAAGVVFGLASLVKIFPLFVSPVFFIWAVRNATRKRDVATFVGSAVATAAAFCLPFFVGAPFGFLNQTLFMHMERPLQGFSPLGLLYVGNFTLDRFGVGLWTAPAEWVGPMLSMALLVPALLLAFAFATSRRADLRHLLVATTVAILLVLTVSKVVNEQYFVMPIALLAVLAHAPGAERLHRWTLRAWTVGGLIAGLLLGFHWLTFIPKDVAPYLLGMQPMEALHGLGVFAHTRLGIHPDVFYVLPDVLTVLAVAPAFALSAALVWRPVREGAARVLSAARGPGPHRGLAVVTAISLVGFPLAFAGATADAVLHAPGLAPMPELPGRLVGATYYTWWNNPSRDPDTAWGNWELASLTPRDGYFTTNGRQMEVDVRGMREAGIDFAAVSYHGYDHNRYLVFAKVARHFGLHFAPLVEAGEVFGNRAYATVSDDPAAPITLRPSESAAGPLAELVRRSLEAAGSEAFLRIDGKPVVFVQDGHYLGPSWDEESKRDLARAVVERYHGDYGALAKSWNRSVATLDDVVALYPANVTAFLVESRVAGDWRLALEDREARLWEIVREAAGRPVHLVSTTSPWFHEMVRQTSFWTERPRGPDAAFLYGAAPAYVRTPLDFTPKQELTAYERQVRLNAEWWKGASFAAVHHAYDDSNARAEHVEFRLARDDALTGGDTYAWFWRLAADSGTRHVLIASWNNFFDGTAIQPTKEHGDAALAATRAYADAFRAHAPPPPEKRHLVLTNAEAGLPAHPADKRDWTFYLSVHLPWRLREADPEAEVRHVEIDELRLPSEPLARPLAYNTVWVEPGKGIFDDATPDELNATFARLMDHVYRGGTLVLLGGLLPKPFEDAYLADGYGNVHAATPGGTVSVRWDGGVAEFPDTDRYTAVRVHDNCEPIATFVESGSPAAWKCALGDGHLIATAFRPQSWDTRDDPGAAEILRHIMAEAHADVPPDAHQV